jgi:23S rRNA pseudouridine1911/1915/1917 synthase
LKKDSINFKSVIVPDNEGKRAFLNGNRIDKNIGEVEPQTGRYHQIRIQSSNRGYPILGDVHYGGKEWENKGIALHASFLSFRHPRNEEIMNFENLSDRF